MTLTPLRFLRFPALALGILALTPAPGLAQQTAGSITGRVLDQDGGALPGALITATNEETGFVRNAASDSEGVYRLPSLPPGTYTVASELDGFSRLELPRVTVHLSRTTDLLLEMRLARLAETITVTGRTPLVPTTSSSIGEVMDLRRLESLPLNGRQFANLAALVPGVGLGFHSDVTKPIQYSPQISGGNGRNINYLVDGGDNNDDTVGGLLQQFPLEAIQEFNVITQRFDAQFGRSNGGVLNVLTRSGTNELRGSVFTFVRDEALNAHSFSEKLAQVDKQAYGRLQFGGSIGGPIALNRIHYFFAAERTQQDTKQAVDTLGLFPAEDGVYDTPLRQTLLSAKVTASAGRNHYLAARYGTDVNSQPNGPALRVAPSAWTTSDNNFHSVNGSDNWVVGGAKLNELVFQYSRFRNEVPGTGSSPMLRFPNGVMSGASQIAPQSTEQDKWHLRNDLSWNAPGFGLGHDFKVGVNWIHEPHLLTSTQAGFTGMFMLGGNSLTAPVTTVQVFGGAASVNIPLDMYGVYFKDDWRINGRLTLNLGVRWDYVSGMPIDQSANPNFLAMQAAGATGRFEGTALEDFGKEPEGDKDNIQPRIGFAYDIRGDGRDVIRGGWGVYTDFAYTNANALTPAIDAQGGAGMVFSAVDPTGLKKADGSPFVASEPLSAIAHLNTVNPNVRPLVGMVLSPRIKQPYTRQTSIGWAHEIDPRTVVIADFVHVTGHDLNLRLRPNTLVNGQRLLTGIPIQPNNAQFRTAISGGSSRYDAFTISIRRRFIDRLDVSAWYTRSQATSTIGSSYDELDLDVIQNVMDPFGPVQDAPSIRTDAPNRFTASAIWSAPYGIQVAPVFLFRSGLPLHTREGRDLNGDGNPNDATALAYRYTGIDDRGVATYEETGPCETVNCSRRAPFSQLNLRVSRGFALGGARVEAIAEVFNLLNRINPALPNISARLRAADGAPLSSFMQPEAYAGDFRQPEQRVGQLGFRITF